MLKQVTMPTDRDWRIVESIGMLPASQRTMQIVEKLLDNDFVANYPALTRMLASPDLDKHLLKVVIDHIRMVTNGKESLDAASVDVGQALARAYFPQPDLEGASHDRSRT